MISIKHRFLILSLCIAMSIWLLIAQVFGSVLILIPCLVCFLVLVAWAGVQGVSLPVLMFFLPFAPLLKFGQGSISFFTLALLIVYLVYAVTGSRNIKIYHLIPALCIIVLTIIVKTMLGYSFDNSYILFSVALLLVPFVSRETDGKYDFYWITVFFVLGITVAAITSQYLVLFPNIAGYIETFDLFGAVRHAGYYGDPNFYSAHITVALAGIMVLSFSKLSKSKLVSLIIMSAILLYCGLLSVSKSFVLITICLFLMWLLALMFHKGKISGKITILFMTSIGIMFLLSSTVFTDGINMVVERFARDDNLSDFTTGRLDIWMNYMHEFESNLGLLLFGKGYSHVLVGGRAAHNTIIQIVFQLGIIGSVFMIVWIVCLFHNFLQNTVLHREGVMPVLILMMGAFGPWLALDLMFFDEFFIVPMYVCIGIRYILQKDLTVPIKTTRMVSKYE